MTSPEQFSENLHRAIKLEKLYDGLFEHSGQTDTALVLRCEQAMDRNASQLSDNERHLTSVLHERGVLKRSLDPSLPYCDHTQIALRMGYERFVARARAQVGEDVDHFLMMVGTDFELYDENFAAWPSESETVPRPQMAAIEQTGAQIFDLLQHKSRLAA